MTLEQSVKPIDLPEEPCPECLKERRAKPFSIVKGGLCWTHYNAIRRRERAAKWDGQRIERARDFQEWPRKKIPYPHQLDWLDFCQDNDWVLILAPCDHGKTDTLTTYIAWRIADNPDIRVVVCSAVAAVAKLIVGAVISILENNQDYIKYFRRLHGFAPKPDRPKQWTKEAVTVNRYAEADDKKDPTLVAIGKGGELENRRIDLFLGDDMITKKAAESQVQRGNDLDWFLEVVMSRGEEDCEVKLIGTPEHPDDLYETIATGNTETGERFTDFFNVIRVRAVAPKGESHCYTDTENIIDELEYPDGQLKALCPDLMSLKGLLKRGRLSRSAFMKKYQCRHMSSIEKMYPIGKLNACKDADLLIPENFDQYDRNFRMTLMGVDIATGVAHSFFAMVLIGIDESFRHVLLNLYRGKARFAQQLEMIVKWYRRYVPMHVGVESNGQQNTIIDAYKNARVVAGVDIRGIERVTFEPVFTDKSLILSTETGLSALVDNGALVFPDGDLKTRQTIEPLVTEMKNFPSGSTKDCLRALQIAEQLYALKVGPSSPGESDPNKSIVRGAHRKRRLLGRGRRFIPRQEKQPPVLDGFGLPRAGGCRPSLIELARRKMRPTLQTLPPPDPKK